MTLSKSTLSFAILTSLTCTSTFSAEQLAKKEPSTKQTSPSKQITTLLTDTSVVNNLEIITVNSGFRQQNLQKTAASLSVLTDENIRRRNAQNLEELVASAPNINFASGSQRARYYQIRGIGERSQFQAPINPSVGLIIDDIEFSGIGGIASTFDVSQVEILRGPQGTRFGASAMAGLINITTNKPTDEFEGALQIKAESYNGYGAGLVLSGPANDKVNYRVAVEQYQSDGFIKNTFLNRKNTNNRDELTFRGKLEIKASDNLTINLTSFYFNFDNGYDAFSLDNNRKTMSDQPGFDRQETSALASKFFYSGLDNVDVITILSYADSNLAYGYDEDWSFVGLHPWEYSSTDHYFRDRKTMIGEVRVLSKTGNEIFNGSTAWVAGLYMKQDNEDLLRQYTYLSNDFSSTFDTKTYAAYLQFDSQLTDKLTLTSGVRFEQRNADYQNSNVLDAALFAKGLTDNMLGGKLVLAYQQNDDSLWYAQIDRGYKAGGANTDGTLPDKLRTFAPEYVWNYELGYKVSLLNNQAYLRSAIFYMDRKDVQVQSSETIVHADGSSEFTIFLDNAASGTNRGVEVEGGWQVNDLIELYGALGLLDTQFNGFINASGENLSGRAQAYAPNYQANLGINIRPNNNWLVNVSFDSKDDYYFSDSHDQKSQAVALFNASVAYTQDNWQAKLWARNLLNKNYATRGFYFGNDPRDGYQEKLYTQLAEPLVFGATLDYQF